MLQVVGVEMGDIKIYFILHMLKGKVGGVGWFENVLKYRAC